MTEQRRSRLLAMALGLSVLVHMSTFLWFSYGPNRLYHAGHKGVVSVDFIQPISHDSLPQEIAPRALKRHETLKEKTPDQPPKLETAPMDPPTNQSVGDPAAIARESSAFIIVIAKRLNQSKVYPRLSIDREEEGRVIVGVTLDRDGSLLDTKIEEPSNFSRLNEAALQTVRNVGKFPGVPESVPAPLHLHVPIVFQIEHN